MGIGTIMYIVLLYARVPVTMELGDILDLKLACWITG